MYAGVPRNARRFHWHLTSPLRATLLAVLVVVVAFATPLTPRAQASSNPGLTVSPGRLEVKEGASSSYTVVLDSQPASNATVTVDPGNQAGEYGATFSPTSLVFTTSNWDSPQSVTVTGLQDDDDFSIQFSVRHSVTVDRATFRFSTYLIVTLIDDDREEVEVSDATLTLFEGETRSYTVWLNRQPKGDVSISLGWFRRRIKD